MAVKRIMKNDSIYILMPSARSHNLKLTSRLLLYRIIMTGTDIRTRYMYSTYVSLPRLYTTIPCFEGKKCIGCGVFSNNRATLITGHSR